MRVAARIVPDAMPARGEVTVTLSIDVNAAV